MFLHVEIFSAYKITFMGRQYYAKMFKSYLGILQNTLCGNTAGL